MVPCYQEGLKYGKMMMSIEDIFCEIVEFGVCTKLDNIDRII